MSFSGFIVQLINGLASASSLFLVAAGLSLIFGVTRIVNFAHGSFFMVGIYVAYSLVERLSGALGFWVALPLAALIVGVLGALIEVVLHKVGGNQTQAAELLGMNRNTLRKKIRVYGIK